jgi:hypothetical protein
MICVVNGSIESRELGLDTGEKRGLDCWFRREIELKYELIAGEGEREREDRIEEKLGFQERAREANTCCALLYRFFIYLKQELDFVGIYFKWL